VRIAPIVVALLALSACGRAGGTAGLSDLAGGVGPDGGVPAPDAATDPGPSPDTHVEASAAELPQRDAIPMLEDAMLVPTCGVPGAKCPTYAGSTVWMFSSSYQVSGSMGPDGSIYIGGSIDNTFNFDPMTQAGDFEGIDGQASAFLMKLGPTAAYESTFTIGGESFGTPQMGAPAVTANALFAPGYFDGTIDLDPGPGMDVVQDIVTRGGSFISKFDAAKKFIWGRVLLSSENGLVYWGGPVAAPDGGVILTGNYLSPANLAPDPIVLAAPNQSGAFVTRLDASGNQLWVRTFGGDSCDGASMSAALDAGGVLWLSGTGSGNCAFDQAGPAGAAPSGFFVASMTLDGKIVSFGTMTGDSQLTGPPVVASDGSITLVVSIAPSSPGQNGPIYIDPSGGVSNLSVPDTSTGFVMKLDHDGKLRWLHPLDFDLSIFGAIALTPDDGMILAGGWNSGRAGMSIVKLGADGNEAWRLLTGGPGTRPDNILVNATGFFVLGEQSGTGDLDPTTGVDFQVGPILFLSKYTF
jgi:hypothetical protein